MTEPPLISVVTMAWRNECYAHDFLRSLARAARFVAAPAPEVIVVVNGPEGDSAERTLAGVASVEHIHLTVLRLGRNAGYSGGANAGVRIARGEVVVVANLDVTFDDHFFAVLHREMAQPEGGWHLVAPRVVQGPAGDDSGVSRRTASQRLAWVSPPAAAGPVPGGNGACLVLRRTALEQRMAEVGDLFDPEYHSFNEDIDLFWWAARRKLVIRYVPDLEVVHALAGSFAGAHRFRDRPVDIQRRVMANYRVTVWKNASGFRDWLGWPLGEAVYGGQAAIFGRLGGLRTYAASWPEAIRTASAIRRRRGRLRPPATRPA